MAVEADTTTPAPGLARVRASVRDYLVIVAWLAVLTAIGFGIRPLLPTVTAATASPIPVADLAAFGFSVLPVWAYLTITEAGARHGTWGKRRVGLRVIASNGGHPT